MRAELPAPTGLAANRRIVKAGLILVAILSIPVVALLLLQAGVLFACATAVTAEGVAEGHIAWRITRMECRNGKEPFYDVAVGAEHKALVTALTSRGAPAPVGVKAAGDGLIHVILDGAGSTGATTVPVALRKSGSPRERIDLQAPAPRR